jgi:hypothetical protein
MSFIIVPCRCVPATKEILCFVEPGLESLCPSVYPVFSQFILVRVFVFP